MGKKVPPSTKMRRASPPPSHRINHPKESSSSSSKKTPKAQPQAQPKTLPPKLSSAQQLLLTTFSAAFSPILTSETFPTLLQEIKTALFNRDFALAFGREDYLETYAARWSPTRALCYADVLEGMRGVMEGIEFDENLSAEDDVQTGAEGDEQIQPPRIPRKTMNMIAVGGCAAEHVAFSAFLSNHPLTGNLTLLDSAPWGSVTEKIHTALISPPPISESASEAKKEANYPLISASQLKVNFIQTDILELDKDQLCEKIGTQRRCLVSILFTLNELYTNGGIAKTTKLLKNLGEALAHRSLLLVLDSPGSYSEAALGSEKKKYPMQWLLDHTLIKTKSEGYSWDKLESTDSEWFRLAKGFKYPMELENMRYQMHLYRLVKRS